MLKFFLTFCTALLLLSCSIFESDSFDENIKVMTFNIRYGTAEDSLNAWEFRNDFVIDIIQSNNLHILGLQEALDFQLDEIMAQNPNYRLSGVGRKDGKKAGEWAAILFDKRRFNLLEEGTFWFSDSSKTPGSRSWNSKLPRICSYVLLRDMYTNTNIYTLNNHWDNSSKISREKSAQLLLEKLASRKDLSAPIIVMGDFNASADSSSLKILLENSIIPLEDSYGQINTSTLNIGTRHNFKGGIDGPKIDAILLSGKIETLSADIIRTSRNGQFPSDHFPVTATLSIRAE